MKMDNMKMVETTIEMTEPCYEFYLHAAKGHGMELGDWILEVVAKAINRGLYKDLTGYEYDEMQEEIEERLKEGDERSHPTLVHNDMLEEWHYHRFKKELEYAIGAEWFCKEMVEKAKELREYIIEGDEIWEAKMSEPVVIEVIHEVNKGSEE